MEEKWLDIEIIFVLLFCAPYYLTIEEVALIMNTVKETVAYLLACGADMNTQGNNGWTPLHEASFKGHNEVVEYLLIAGANEKIEDRNGRTALMRAHDEVTRTVFHLRRPQWREEGYDRH